MSKYDENIVSDLHKDAFGFRPTQDWWIWWNKASEAERQIEWDSLCQEVELELESQRRRDEAAIEAFELHVLGLVQLGGTNRLTAIRWVVESLELTENDLYHGPDYVCYCLGLPYSLSSLFTEAVDYLRKKETV